MLALASLLRQDGLLADEMPSDPANPLAPRLPHFAPKAKACICIYLEGAPSQIDLFDPKPKLNELNGQKLPESITKNVRFAFIQKEGGRAPGHAAQVPQTRAVRHGTVGLAAAPGRLRRRHRPGPVDAHRRVQPPSRPADDGHRRAEFGRPSMGSGCYGLGRGSQNLPGYVVLNSRAAAPAAARPMVSGFLPTTYQGVLFRDQGEPVLNLNNPAGLSERCSGRPSKRCAT